MICSFTLLWDKVILLQHYRILRFASKISCPALTGLNVTQRRLKSFTAPRFFHRPNQFLLSRLEIVQFRWVMKSRTLGVTLDRHLTFKTHINNICRSTSPSTHLIGKIRNLLSRSTTERRIHAFVSSKRINTTAFFTAYPPTSYRIYNGCKIQPQG